MLRAGLKAGAAWIKKTYGVNVNVNLIGTTDTDPPSQISQIQSLTSAGQLDCVGAVSYTHLDVYKRQVYDGDPGVASPLR